MHGELFIKYLESLTPLSSAFIADLKGTLHKEHYKAHQVIHASGQVEHRFWFLLHGFARSYYIDPQGKDHTVAFYVLNDLIFSYKGFWKEPGDRYIEILASSELVAISYKSLHRLNDQYPEVRILIRHFTHKKYDQDTITLRLLTRSAEERYQVFRQARPDIFKLASLRLIASYLNMTRENLSRLLGRENR